MFFYVAAVILPTGSPAYFDWATVEANNVSEAIDLASRAIYFAEPKKVVMVNVSELPATNSSVAASFAFSSGGERVYVNPPDAKILTGFGKINAMASPESQGWKEAMQGMISEIKAQTGVDGLVPLLLVFTPI